MSTIKEIPILYSTTMVEAIIEERKTKTRRCKGLNKINESPSACKLDTLTISKDTGILWARFVKEKDGKEEHAWLIKCPYGKPGDLLYVRETWQHTKSAINLSLDDENSGYIYKASQNGRDWASNMDDWTWKPGIHLPKEGSRIWLEITDVGVERLQDISEEDAKSEGINEPCWERKGDGGCSIITVADQRSFTMLGEIGDYATGFKALWNQINGDKYTWEDNPWVWVVSFRVLSTTGKPNS
jgi:hypothetical protein